MPTPKAGYWRDGHKLPGVTTILKQSDQSGLISAANAVGVKGQKVYGADGVWSLSGDIGTATHARIQAHLEHREWLNEEGLSQKVVQASIPPFSSFLRWAAGRQLPGECEVGLVHPELPYGGTIDYLDRGVGYIYDWKTNSSLDYLDSLYGQIGAYTMLAEAHGIGITETTIVRFPKEGGDAEELKIDPSSEKGIAGQTLFKLLLAAYGQREIISRKDIEPGLVARSGRRRR